MSRSRACVPAVLFALNVCGATVTALPLAAQEITNAAADPWCRLDDPGASEVERRKLKLSANNLGNLPCPPRISPQQRPDELILPMPCGRAMVFRKIAVPMRDILDHRKAYLGVIPEGPADPLNKPSRAVINGPREAFVSGSLSLGSAGDRNKTALQRGFYLGKYEVTALQYEIFLRGLLTPDGAHVDPSDPACKSIVEQTSKVSGTLVLPATRVSWFDALDFARAYTEWLLAQDRASLGKTKAPSALPWEESSPAFLRLPTAAEWEYAARGGDVSPASQSSRLYDVVVEGQRRRGALEEIASMTSAQNAPPDGAEVHYAGRKLPNVFGLYDMVGNAAEIVLDLFQPRRPDQLLGTLGGYVQMGGAASDTDSAIGVGARTEVPLYKKDGLVRSPSTGFRLALSSPFMVNKRQEDWGEAMGNPLLDADIDKAYQSLLAQTSAPGAEERAEADDKVNRLQQVLEKQKEDIQRQRGDSETWKKFTDELQGELKSVKASLDRSTAAINEREAQLRVEQVRSIVLIASNINAVDRQIRVSDQNTDRLKQRLASSLSLEEKKMISDGLSEIAAMRAQLTRSNDGSFRYYVETVRLLAETPPTGVAQAATQVQRQFDAEGNTVFNAFKPLAEKHIDAARKGHGALSDAVKTQWLNDIKSTQRTRVDSP